MKKALARFPAPHRARTPFALRTRLVSAVVLLGILAGLGLFASRPARTAGGPIPVNVANTPLPTTATDNPAKQPVQVQEVLSQNGINSTFYSVPAGKRFVIEYVNIFADIQNDPNHYSFVIQTGSVLTDFSLDPDGSPFVGASQKVLLYAEPGSLVTGFFLYNGTNSFPEIYVTLTGYLVDAP